MMGHRQVEQAALFYEFSLERHVPSDHLLRSVDRFVELGEMRQELAPFYSTIGRPSIDPELMIRMLIVGYRLGIRSERRLCEEVHLNLAYRWFCRLGLDGSGCLSVLRLRLELLPAFFNKIGQLRTSSVFWRRQDLMASLDQMKASVMHF